MIEEVIREILALAKDRPDESSGLSIRKAWVAPAPSTKSNRFFSEIEQTLQAVIPPDLKCTWQKLSSVRLFEDIKYGQWGLIISSPAEVIKNHRERVSYRDPDDVLKGDLFVGHFLGDGHDMIVRCDRDADDFGSVVIATPMYRRSDWFLVASSVAEFLQKYLDAGGKMFWYKNHTS